MRNDMTRLGDLCEFRYGKSLPAQNRRDGPFAVYGSNGVVGFHDEAITEGKTIVVGRKGSIGEINVSARSCWPIDTTYYIDRDATEVNIDWLSRALSSLRLPELNKAAAVPGLNRSDAYERRLFVPMVDEQRRIAAILDKADALRRKRKRAQELLDGLTQSIFLGMFGELSGGDMQPLGSITTEIYRYPTYYGIEYETDGVAEVRGELIKEDGSILTDRSALRFISNDTASRFSKTRLNVGDLVMSVRGTIGKIGLVPDELDGANITANLVRIAPDRSKVIPKYLWIALRSDRIKRALIGATASTTIATIKAPDLRNLQIAVPTLADQRRFCRALESLGAGTSQSIKHSQKLEAMFASLQHRAFSGQL